MSHLQESSSQPLAGEAEEQHTDGGGGSKAKVNKMNCTVCKKSTKRIQTNRDGGVKCGVCQFWWHPKCLNMDPDLLKWIVMGEKLGNDCCWTCLHCQEAHIKTEQAIKAMSSRMKTVEQKVDHVEARQEKMEDKQELTKAKQEKVNTEFEERLKKLELNSAGNGMVREMDDRMDKSNNLVMHRVPESNSEDPKDRQAHDAAVVKVLMEKYLGIKDMDTDNKLRFLRRLGRMVEGADARPILLGLKFTADLELVLDRSWMLGQCNNKAANEINIVRDLTAKQRQREADLVSEAAKKNLERSQEELDESLVYKVVGRKGEKREIKVALRQGEEVDDTGNVTRKDGWARGKGREPIRPYVTGGNREPIGQARPDVTAAAAAIAVDQPQSAKTPDQKDTRRDKGQDAAKGGRVRENSKGSGDWEWEAAAGKRGRPSPSPDKVMKRVKGEGCWN